MEPSGDAVKISGFARLFEGWQLGAGTVALVLSAALIAVPRASQPGLFPVPLVDVGEEKSTRARYDELADRAERRQLPFETRAVGDAVRRLGAALAGQRPDVEHQRRVLAERLVRAFELRQHDRLAELRALQARLFVRAVREQDFTSPLSAELAQLGGDFAVRAERSGWLSSDGCVATDDELRTLFAFRWNEITQLRDDARFRPSLAELRRYYRFLLLHPETRSADEHGRTRARLRYVAALSRRDGEYPAALSRGSLLAELGAPVPSSEALMSHLSRASGSVWTLRARNYLLAVAGEAMEEP